jgi:hypothetical protein
MFILVLGCLIASPLVASATPAPLRPGAPPISPLQLLKTSDTIPSEWLGVWSFHVVQKDCTTHIITADTTVLDTLCTSSNIEPDSTAAFPLSCDYQVEGNGYHLVCDGTVAVTDSCTALFHEDLTGTVSGGSFQVEGTFSFSYQGSCFGIPDQCTEYTSTGTRINSDPAVCQGTPVEPTTWGIIKSRYQ